MKFPLKAMCLFIAFGLVAAMPAAAQRFPSADGGGNRGIVKDQSGSPGLGRAVSRLRKQVGGRVLSAETRGQEESSVHHIRILTDEGKVRRFRVDGESGRLLNRKR